MASRPDHFGLYTYEDWARNALKKHHPILRPFAVGAGTGEIRIEPGIVEQLGVTVLGHDWIPILADGRATIDRMVHTPELYIDKMRNVVADGDEFRMKVSRIRVCDRESILVGGSRNYYHWFINHVPRLLWAHELGLLEARAILVNDQLTSFQRETFELLRIPSTRLVEVPDDEAVLCPNLLVPSFLARSTLTHHAVPKLLKAALRPTNQETTRRRIYISRRDARSRRIVNEPEVEAMLHRFGFESVRLGMMSLQEQINLFSNAEVVAGAHGAGLTNILFCPEKTRIFEIYTPKHKVSSMRLLSLICGHDHVMVPAENVSFGSDGNPLLGDWQLDVQRLQTEIEQGLTAAQLT